jgi:two-component system nitrogen regulation sensor histidine kinase NtrY
LFNDFCKPIEKCLQLGRHFNGPIEIKSGENDFILMADASRIRDEHDVEVGTIIVFDDMSVVARVQRVAAWKEVARRIAHEIKNPITPIKLNAERLMRRYQSRFEGDDKVVFESCVQTIIHQVDSLRDLVNEFSKFTRMPNLKIELICLKSLIEEALDMFRMSYPSLEIDTSGIVSLPDLPLDKEQMKRVFVNLMTNSIAAFVQGRQGKIKIKAELIEKLDIVRIEFSDNGSGIPKELWNRVLEPYFSTKREGTGLGLAIVNQIISDHGGYLRLGGNEPYGATVVIELPVVQKDKRLSMV